MTSCDSYFCNKIWSFSITSMYSVLCKYFGLFYRTCANYCRKSYNVWFIHVCWQYKYQKTHKCDKLHGLQCQPWYDLFHIRKFIYTEKWFHMKSKCRWIFFFLVFCVSILLYRSKNSCMRKTTPIPKSLHRYLLGAPPMANWSGAAITAF